MNKPIYLGLSIPELSKTLMNEFWYDHVKRKIVLYGCRKFYIIYKSRWYLKRYCRRCWS